MMLPLTEKESAEGALRAAKDAERSMSNEAKAAIADAANTMAAMGEEEFAGVTALASIASGEGLLDKDALFAAVQRAKWLRYQAEHGA